MGQDNPTLTLVSDTTQQNAAATEDTSHLSQLQKDAGLYGNTGMLSLDKLKGESDIKPIDGAGVVDIMRRENKNSKIDPVELWINRHMQPGAITREPTDYDRALAKNSLDIMMGNFVPEADREAAKAITTAITLGDARALSEALKKYGGNPEKLKELCHEVGQALEASGCTTRLNVTGDGKVLLSDTQRDTALALDPASGKVEARAVRHNLDGSILVKPGSLVHVDLDKSFKDLQDRAVNSVNAGRPEHAPGMPPVWPRINPGHPYDQPASGMPYDQPASGKPYDQPASGKPYDQPASGMPFSPGFERPSPNHTDTARSSLLNFFEHRMSKLIPEADRQTMKAMITAITNGDARGFSEALKKCGGDPQKLKALIDEVDTMMEEKGCSTRLDITDDGKVLVSDTGLDTALAFDPASGKVEVKAVEHNTDGSMAIQPGELLNADTNKAFALVGAREVSSFAGDQPKPHYFHLPDPDDLPTFDARPPMFLYDKGNEVGHHTLPDMDYIIQDNDHNAKDIKRPVKGAEKP